MSFRLCFHHFFSLFYFPLQQRHDEDRHLLGRAPGQDPQQRAGNVVPNAADTGQDGSSLIRNSYHIFFSSLLFLLCCIIRQKKNIFFYLILIYAL